MSTPNKPTAHTDPYVQSMYRMRAEMPWTGRFVVFEGDEGTGKSTQVTRTLEYLQQRGAETVYLKEPGTTPVGLDVERMIKGDAHNPDPVAEIFLFLAARAEAVDKVIRPALEAGKFVVADRFDLSTEAYQGAGRFYGLDSVLDIIRAGNRLAIRECRPDREFYLNADLSVRNERMQRAGKTDRMERSGDEFFSRVRRYYETIANQDSAVSSRRIVRVDANPNDPASVFANSVQPVLDELLALQK